MRRLWMAALCAAGLVAAGSARAAVTLEFEYPADNPTVALDLHFTATLPYLPDLYNFTLPAASLTSCPSYNGGGAITCSDMVFEAQSQGLHGQLNQPNVDIYDIVIFGFGSGAQQFFYFPDGTFSQTGSTVSIDTDAGARLTITGTADEDQPVPDGYVPPPILGGNSSVPEPAAWALMIAGFGLVGVALRKREGDRRVVGLGAAAD